MSRLLKLTNLSTYIGEMTRTGVGQECAKVLKGQVVRWDDEDAASVMTGTYRDREHEDRTYFTDVTDTHTGKVDWDFTKKKTQEARTPAVPDAPAAAAADASSSAPAATVKRSQRASTNKAAA